MSILWGLLLGLNGAERWPLVGIPVVLFVRMALNAIDGMLAREHNMKTPQGAILNELGDVVSDTALYLPFAFVPGISLWPVVVVVLLSIMSEMTGVVAVQIGAKRRYDGPMGKSDRAFVFGFLAFLLSVGVPVSSWVTLLLWGVVGLLVVTIMNRARRALGEVLVLNTPAVSHSSSSPKARSNDGVS
jgi:CDP-diacylglycerol--glycerol-3-phosphate 3-phosphatidyltransferase